MNKLFSLSILFFAWNVVLFRCVLHPIFFAELGAAFGRRIVQKTVQPIRAGGGHGHGAPLDPKYGDFKMPHVSPVHKYAGQALGTTMWFWIFYRAYYDLPTLLGHHPWHDEHDEH